MLLQRLLKVVRVRFITPGVGAKKKVVNLEKARSPTAKILLLVKSKKS